MQSNPKDILEIIIIRSIIMIEAYNDVGGKQ